MTLLLRPITVAAIVSLTFGTATALLIASLVEAIDWTI